MRQADNPGGSVSAADLTARVACALLLVPVLLSPAYEVANWPNVNTPTLVGVLIVAGLLALTAGLGQLRPPLLRPLLLLAAILLTWGPAVATLALRLPPTVRPPFTPHATVCAACDELWANMTVLPGGLFVTAAVLLVAAAIPLAIWRRAPGRDAGGRVVRATYAVRCLALVCIFCGPPLGLFAWLSFANGDVYGSFFGIGIMVGLFGLLLFTAHSAAWALLRRSLPSAGTAVVCAALVVLLPLNPGPLSGTFSSRSEVIQRATVQATLANGWSVSATSATVAGPLPGAFDGDSETTWNSGSGAGLDQGQLWPSGVDGKRSSGPLSRPDLGRAQEAQLGASGRCRVLVPDGAEADASGRRFFVVGTRGRGPRERRGPIPADPHGDQHILPLARDGSATSLRSPEPMECLPSTLTSHVDSSGTVNSSRSPSSIAESSPPVRSGRPPGGRTRNRSRDGDCVQSRRVGSRRRGVQRPRFRPVGA